MFSRLQKVKSELLSQVADQIKALQLGQYSSQQEKNDFIANNDNIHIQCLIDLLDHILLHGLHNVDRGYWPYVSKFTHTETIRQITAHPHVSNDFDKGIMWIFVALYDGLLECYFNMFIQDVKTTKKHYVRNALLRDKENILILKTLLAGIDTVEISLDLNHPYMGYPNLNRQLSNGKKGAVPKPSSNHGSPVSNSISTSVSSATSNSPTSTLTPTSPSSLDFGSVSTIVPSYDNRIGDKSLDTTLDLTTELDELNISEDVFPSPSETHTVCNGDMENTCVTEHVEDKDNAPMPRHEEDLSGSVLLESNFDNVLADQNGTDLKTEMHEAEAAAVDEPKKQNLSALSAAIEVSRGIPARTISVDSADLSMDDLELVHTHRGKKHRLSGRRKRRVRRSHSNRSMDSQSPHREVLPHRVSVETMAKNQDTTSKILNAEENVDPQGVLIDSDNATASQLPSEENHENLSSSPSWRDIVFEGVKLHQAALKHLEYLKEDQDSDSVISGDSYDEFCRSLDLPGSLSSSEEMIFRPASPLTEWDRNGSATGQKQDLLELPGEQTKLEDERSLSSVSSKHEIEYDAIMLCGLPRRPSLSQVSSTSADYVPSQNCLLSMALNMYKEDGEKFVKMIRVSTGHMTGQLQTGFLLITNKNLYILRKGSSDHDFRPELSILLRDLQKIEIGLNCQTVRLVSALRCSVVETGDEAVTRNIVSAISSAVAQAGSSPLANLVTSSSIAQEANIKQWIAQKDLCQVVDVDVVCFSLVQWYCLSGPESMVAMLSYQVLKEGFLSRKQKHLAVMSYWQKSYFVLMHGTLYEYADQGDKEAKLILDLKSSTCGGCRRISDAYQPYTFEIISSDGSPLLVLSASTEDEAADWIFKLCQTVADAFDVNEASLSAAIPCGVIVTQKKVVVVHSDPQKPQNFTVISKCSIQDITKLVIDNQLPNYCILKYDNPEYQLVESSWFLWFRTEFELGKFEKSLAGAWKDLYQVDLQFVIIGEGPTRRKVRELGKHVTAVFDD